MKPRQHAQIIEVLRRIPESEHASRELPDISATLVDANVRTELKVQDVLNPYHNRPDPRFGIPVFEALFVSVYHDAQLLTQVITHINTRLIEEQDARRWDVGLLLAIALMRTQNWSEDCPIALAGSQVRHVPEGVGEFIGMYLTTPVDKPDDWTVAQFTDALTKFVRRELGNDSYLRLEMIFANLRLRLGKRDIKDQALFILKELEQRTIQKFSPRARIDAMNHMLSNGHIVTSP